MTAMSATPVLCHSSVVGAGSSIAAPTDTITPSILPTPPVAEAYEEPVGPHRALDLLAEPAGVANIEFVVPKNTDAAQPATFE